MNKKEFIKWLKEGFYFVVVGIGFYNVILLLDYFKSGRDISVIPSKKVLFLFDLRLLFIGMIVVTLIDLIFIFCYRRKNKRTDSSSGSEE